MAFHAGFASQRAERTWKLKLKALHKLRFIDLKSGPSGPESYALIWNPYLVIKWHRQQKTTGLREDKYNALAVRALEIGDKTFAPPEPNPAAPPASTASEAPTPPSLAEVPASVPSVQAATTTPQRKLRASGIPLKSTSRAGASK
jgi:hypothetical protein